MNMSIKHINEGYIQAVIEFADYEILLIETTIISNSEITYEVAMQVPNKPRDMKNIKTRYFTYRP